ncbi:MAG: gamma-glutamyltransferase [Phycisphaerales bacterium]|jgi:gamma-glutamyltranspeptidase/glutathione hydrolase
MMRMMKLLGAACAFLAITPALAALQDAPAPQRTGGMVAADHPLAAQAGATMLARGGNAVDAAVATSFALSVVRSDACGIGGGGFMLIHLVDDPRHGDVTIAINYRETCPAGVGPDTYAGLDDPLASQRGGMAVGVPGTVAGLLHALENYGTLPRDVVLAPAIELAEGGFEADPHHVRTVRSLVDRFEADESWRRRFPLVWERLADEGRLEVGDRIRLPEQAAALVLIARDGADAFYRGAIAEAIVESVRADGGVLTMEDLAGYQLRQVEPVRATIGGRTVLSMPPPSSGGVAIAQVLALAERLDLAMPATGWPAPAEAHALAESMKHAFADRSRHMADPAFVDVPVAAMLSQDALDRMAAAIDPRGVLEPEAYGTASLVPVALPEDGGTSHISVIDANGGAVACTETINLAFGSMVGARGFGFCLNDQMDDFTTKRGEANAFGLVQSDDNLPEPGKRPLSSMSPTIVLDADGEVTAVAGASGGPRIITSTAQVLLRMLRGGATAKQAVDAPRLHHQWLPDRLYVEVRDGAEPAAGWSRALEQLGHDVFSRDDIGAVQAIRRDPTTGELDGAADPRKGGAAVRP